MSVDPGVGEENATAFDPLGAKDFRSINQSVGRRVSSAGLRVVYDGRNRLGGFGTPVGQAGTAVHSRAGDVQDTIIQRRSNGHEGQANGHE